MPKPDVTAPPDADLLTLEQLRDKLAKPATGYLAALVGDAREPYISVGRQIRTARVLTDARRLYATAYAFWAQASEAQREELVGFSEPLLAVCVEHALALAALEATSTRKAAEQGAKQTAREDAITSATQRAVARRLQMQKTLLRVAGDDANLAATVHGKNLGADTPANLAATLRGLAEVGRALLKARKKDNDPVAIRIKIQRLDESRFEALEAAAAEVESAGTTVAGPTRPVDQGELDYHDGVQLHLLEHVLDAFEKAHDIDPSIPRLVPISTRRLLGSHTRRTTETPKQPTPPAA